MTTKFLLVALICALAFTTSNSMRPGMKRSGPPLMPKKPWHHFPYHGGIGNGGGLSHRNGSPRFNGGGANGNGGGEGFAGGNGGFAGGNGGFAGGNGGFAGGNGGFVGGNEGGEGFAGGNGGGGGREAKGEVVDNGGKEGSRKVFGAGSASGLP